MYFIDGENLVFRYQAMVADGWKPQEDVIHERDAYVWREGITKQFVEDIIRVAYYTSCVGDDDRLHAVSESIKRLRYTFSSVSPPRFVGKGTIVPRVFKKYRQEMKSRAVDINIAIDILRHTSDDSIDCVRLMSGDGDFIPLIQEVMRKGKTVSVFAFSKGLHPKIPVLADDFYGLDPHFFHPRQ